MGLKRSGHLGRKESKKVKCPRSQRVKELIKIIVIVLKKPILLIRNALNVSLYTFIIKIIMKNIFTYVTLPYF